MSGKQIKKQSKTINVIDDSRTTEHTKVWDAYTRDISKHPDGKAASSIICVWIPAIHFTGSCKRWTDLLPNSISFFAVKLLSGILEYKHINGTNSTRIGQSSIDNFMCTPFEKKFVIHVETILKDDTARMKLSDDNIVGYRIWVICKDEKVKYEDMIESYVKQTPFQVGKEEQLKSSANVLDFFATRYIPQNRSEEQKSFLEIFRPEKAFIEESPCRKQRDINQYFKMGYDPIAGNETKKYPVPSAVFDYKLEFMFDFCNVPIPSDNCYSLLGLREKLACKIKARNSKETKMGIALDSDDFLMAKQCEDEIMMLEEEIKSLTRQSEDEESRVVSPYKEKKITFEEENLLKKMLFTLRLSEENRKKKEKLNVHYPPEVDIKKHEQQSEKLLYEMLDIFENTWYHTDRLSETSSAMRSFMRDKVVNSEYSLTCPEGLTPFGNYISQTMNDITNTSGIEVNQDYFLKVQTAALDGSRSLFYRFQDNPEGFSPLKLNVLLEGEKETGKSKILQEVVRWLVPGTSRPLVQFSKNAFTGGDPYGTMETVLVMEEAKGTLFGVRDNGSTAPNDTEEATTMKNQTTNQVNITLRFDIESGNTVKWMIITTGNLAFATNTFIKNSPMGSRFLRCIMGGDRNPRLGHPKGEFAFKKRGDIDPEEENIVLERRRTEHALVFLTNKLIESEIFQDVDLTVAKTAIQIVLKRMQEMGHPMPNPRSIERVYIAARTKTIELAVNIVFFFSETRDLFRKDWVGTPFRVRHMAPVRLFLWTPVEIALWVCELLAPEIWPIIESDVMDVVSSEPFNHFPPQSEKCVSTYLARDEFDKPEPITRLRMEGQNWRNLIERLRKQLKEKYTYDQVENCVKNLTTVETMAHPYQWKISEKNIAYLEFLKIQGIVSVTKTKTFDEVPANQTESSSQKEAVPVEKEKLTLLRGYHIKIGEPKTTIKDMSLNAPPISQNDEDELYSSQEKEEISVISNSIDKNLNISICFRCGEKSNGKVCNDCKKKYCAECEESIENCEKLVKCMECDMWIHNDPRSKKCTRTCSMCNNICHDKCLIKCQETQCHVMMHADCLKSHKDFLCSPNPAVSKMSPVFVIRAGTAQSKKWFLDSLPPTTKRNPFESLKRATNLSHFHDRETPTNYIRAFSPIFVYKNLKGREKKFCAWDYFETHAIGRHIKTDFSGYDDKTFLYIPNNNAKTEVDEIYSQSNSKLKDKTKLTEWQKTIGTMVKAPLDDTAAMTHAVNIGVLTNKSVKLVSQFYLQKVIVNIRERRDDMSLCFKRYPEDPIESLKRAELEREKERRNMKNGNHDQIKSFGEVQVISALQRKLNFPKREPSSPMEMIQSMSKSVLSAWESGEIDESFLPALTYPQKFSKMENI